jgi:hypothetical protein
MPYFSALFVCVRVRRKVAGDVGVKCKEMELEQSTIRVKLSWMRSA